MSVPANTSSWCSCQPMPTPDRNASVTCDSARRPPAQPLRNVPRVGFGPPRQLLRGGRPLGQAAVQAQPVPDDDVSGGDRGAQVADVPAEQLAELVLIDGHDDLPFVHPPACAAAVLGIVSAPSTAGQSPSL